MAAGDVPKKFQDLKISENQDINILLLGETGVGKSTFINAIANYLHFKTFKKAEKAGDLLILIPSVITITDENLEQVTLTVGSDNNEYQEIGASATQDVKTYVFPIGTGKTRLRLIDSPGMGDTRGIEQDDINCENILAYLSQITELHAICFLMKPNNTRKTVFFEYCVKQLLSRLEKSATKNIIFVFTNTRGTDYTPGDTLPCLRTVVDEIKSKTPHATIPLDENIFSLDNEAFRFLVGMKKGIKFNESVQQRFVESWENSSKQCWKLISYIVGDGARDGLKPHQLLNTMSVNEARRIIVQLSQPLADISQLIYDNLRILDRHKDNLNRYNQSLDELKRQLFIPVISLEVTKLTQPVTVCTSTKCADLIKVGDTQKWHYRQRCHDPCYLTNVQKEIVGDVNLMSCSAMGGTRTCMKCTCDFSVHMHVYYLTKTVDAKIEDANVKNNIHMKEQALVESRKLMEQIDQRKKELEEERNIIVKSTAQFAHFLQHNAISPFNDAYKAYIEYLITRERSLGRHGDPDVIYNLEQLLLQYEEMKATFESGLKLKDGNEVSPVTAQTVLNTIHNLYKLKHNGSKIHELLKKQKASRNFEYDKTCEYIHPKTSNLSEKHKGSKTDDESKKDKVKKDKKKGSKTDDEAKKKDRVKKDGRAADDERRQRPPQQNRNTYQQRPRQYNQQAQPNPQWRDPPPPYDPPTNYQYQQPSSYTTPPLSTGGHNRPPFSGGYYNAPLPGEHYRPPPPSGHYGPPSGHYEPPPSSTHYGPPPSSTYYGPPPSSTHYGPPPNGYDSYGHHYAPPAGQYYDSRATSNWQPLPQGYQRHHPNAQNQGNRGRNFQKRGGGGGKRGQSKPRASKGGKSGESSRSSKSDSSEDSS